MCLIDLDIDGDATVLDLVPQSGKVLDLANVVENSEFDSFLHCTAEDLQNFNFDSFLLNPAEDFQDFSFNCPLLTSKESNDIYGLVGTSASVPITIPNAIAYSPQPELEMMPVEMENLQRFCIVLGQNYLQKIVTIHNICKKIARIHYPDVLQNQLLTASRTLTKLADMIVEHREIILQTGVLGALEGLVIECQYALDRLNQDHGIYSRNDTIVIDSFHTYIKDSKVIAYECLMPLSKILRAFACKCTVEQKDRLRGIATKYMQDVDAMDDSMTDVDDKRSVLSGNTLLGVQEAKEKDLKVDGAEEEDDDIEPTGCFFRMFFGRNKKSQQKNEVKLNNTLKCKLASTSSRVVPKKVISMVAARQNKKACKLYGDLLRVCNYGTVEELTKFLARNPKAVTEIQNKPDIFLYATVSRSPEILKCLLANCMPLDLNTADHKGRTLLYYAAFEGKEEIISILIATGANKEGADKNGMRPLHVAAKKGHQASVATLLAHGAIIEAPDAEMNKPLHYAVEHNTRCTGTISMLLNAGADINATNVKLSTPLHAAIRFNRPSAQRLLIQRGADIEALRIRWETPVKYAVSHGKIDMLRTLLTAGADPDALTCENKTALHSAAAHEDHEIVQALLDAGCKVDPRGKNGSTPLYMAAQNGRIRSAQLLVAAGADLDAKRNGRTPVEAARKYKNLGVVEVLEKANLGLPCEMDKVVEDHANDHVCTWEQWFERYVVAAMQWHDLM